MYHFFLGIGCALFVLSVVWWLIRKDRKRMTPDQRAVWEKQQKEGYTRLLQGIVAVTSSQYSSWINCGKCHIQINGRYSHRPSMCPGCASWVYRLNASTIVTYRTDAEQPTREVVRAWIRRNAERKAVARRKSDEVTKEAWKSLLSMQTMGQLAYTEEEAKEVVEAYLEEATPDAAPTPFMQDEEDAWKNRLEDVLPEKVRPPPSGEPVELAAFELDNDTPPPYSDGVDDKSS